MARPTTLRRTPTRKPCKRCGEMIRFSSQFESVCDPCQERRRALRRERRKRHAIPPDVEKRVRGRYLNCFYCGDPPRPRAFAHRPRRLHIDHVEPLEMGGTSDESNLVLACESCNFTKGDKTVVEFVRYVTTGHRFWFKEG